jgi:hypothetical protein
MKNKNRFNSYNEALKRLELLKGQEELQEATKYVLKQNKPIDQSLPEPEVSMPAPDAGSADSLPPAPEATAPEGAPDMPSSEPSSVSSLEPETSPEGGEETEKSPEEAKRSDYMSEVQKYAGKLGQELRDQKEKMEGDDIKYVLNMIISAVDLDKLDLEDLEEIGKNFERDEDEESGEESPESEEPSTEPEPESSEVPAPVAETDLNEEDPMAALDEFINTKIETKESVPLKDMSDLGETDDVVELDLDEIQSQINQSVSEILRKHLPK